MKFGIFFELSVPRPWADGVEKAVYDNALESVTLPKLRYVCAPDQLAFFSTEVLD
jgi:hypothetical protein